MRIYTCKNCGWTLASRLEWRGGQLVLPCWECGAENVVQLFLKVVGLQQRSCAANKGLSTRCLDI